MSVQIQLVDEQGKTIGEMEKVAAHEDGGTWHRAISVLLFDASGRLLLQRRAAGKYHFPNLWANSCCSHPTLDETILEAGKRTCLRELGIQPDLKEIGVIRYEASDPISGLTEREHDHVLTGRLDEDPIPNPEEVSEIRWISIPELKAEIEKQPKSFAPWLPEILSCCYPN